MKFAKFGAPRRARKKKDLVVAAVVSEVSDSVEGASASDSPADLGVICNPPVGQGEWLITDYALGVIDQAIAAHEPERGGVLIALRGTRIIVDFLPDPRPGSSVSYWHSGALRASLEAYLERSPKRQYAGTSHSHPGEMNFPSGQDRIAFTDTLSMNPSLSEAFFPIVLGHQPRELHSDSGGIDHSVALTHGSLWGYAATLADSGLDLRAVPVRVLPLREDTDTALSYATEAGVADLRGDPMEIEVDGGLLPAIRVSDERASGTTGESNPVYVVFPAGYPTSGPMIASSTGVTTIADWDARSSGSLIGQALVDEFDVELGDKNPIKAANLEDAIEGYDRDQLEARLRFHLPAGVEEKFLVIGAGSLGSNMASMLVRSGVRRLVLVDFDEVELANLSRTTFTFADVGRPKVDALRESLQAIAPDVEIEVVNAQIQEMDLSVLAGVDVAVLCSDDMPAEAWLGHHLYERGVPFLSVKMFARGDAGEVVIVDPGLGSPCVRCVIGDAVGGDRGEVNYGTGRIEGALALGPDVVATVARAVKIALALSQKGNGPLAAWMRPMLVHRKLYFQTANVNAWPYISFTHPRAAFESQWFGVEGRDECAVCGTNRSPAPARFGGQVLPGLPPGLDTVFEASLVGVADGTHVDTGEGDHGE